MKLNYPGLLLFGAIALGTAALGGRPQPHGLVIHEWGTFTSVQGGDGNLLTWKPLATSALPPFVYNWNHPGLGRVNLRLMAGKGEMTSLQRLETPVVYFYSDKALTADLSVQFPRGLVTEWFPQAREIGPCVVPRSQSPSAPPTTEVTNPMIHWSGIQVLAPETGEPAPLAMDKIGSHYFAARETDANLVRLDSLSATNPLPQYEKFLFYRGIGNFTTPLRVTMKSDDAVILVNTGQEPLAHLFVLDVKSSSGGFAYVDRLLPGEEKTVPRAVPAKLLSPAALTSQLSHELSRSLVKEGLYPREATAMVNTWKDSWFAEDGTRVLYVLPRAWTDRTLPMTLTPSPHELTRVMVGHAEVLTPALEQNLARQLARGLQGDLAAITQVRQTAKSLGRFAEPAFFRALANLKTPPADQSKLAGIFFNSAARNFE